MPVFYIHVRNGQGYAEDYDGIELSDIDQARRLAVRSGADIIADELKSGSPEVKLTLYIEDAAHHQLLELPMCAALHVSH